MRLLIVDDDADIHRALGQVLEDSGHQVAVEADPERAQKAMAEFRAKTNAIEARMKALEKEIPEVADHAGLKAAIETLRR